MSMSQPGVDPDRMVSLADEEAVKQDATATRRCSSTRSRR